MSFRPGLTGLWQVSGRSNITDFEEVVKLDTKYISEWSVKNDLRIIFKTVVSIMQNAIRIIKKYCPKVKVASFYTRIDFLVDCNCSDILIRISNSIANAVLLFDFMYDLYYKSF